MAIVLTADQRGSRRTGDQVPTALAALAAVPLGRHGRAFERTAGDEIQGVASDGGSAVHVLEVLLRADVWRVGVGVGGVVGPLPVSARAGQGPAFVHARRAIDAAKVGPGRVAVRADAAGVAASVETVLLLWDDLLLRRTTAGWEVADLLARGLSQVEVADRLAVSASAVSQRARAAGLALSARARTLASIMLDDLAAASAD